MCVLADAGIGSLRLPDGAGGDRAKDSDASRRRDATTSLDAGMDADAGSPDGPETLDAAADARVKDVRDRDTSVAVSCGDVNMCLSPVNLGKFDLCEQQIQPYPCQLSGKAEPPCGATGTQSEWLTVTLVDDCDSGKSYLGLRSDTQAPFDLELYEGAPLANPSDGGPAGCPALVASSMASVPDCCLGPHTTTTGFYIPDAGQLYIHVAAAPVAHCATGAPWYLAIAP
jgi:hypothetical protein